MWFRQHLFRWLFLWFFTMACLVPSVFAATAPIGQMVWVKGEVTAKTPEGGSRPLQRQSVVNQGDTIVTGKDGAGQIVFTDGSLVALRSDTVLTLSQYSYSSKQPAQQNSQVMDLVKGGFRTVTGFIAHTHVDGYKVNTPVATIGVRGTDYSLYYAALTGLSVKLDRGAITAVNKAGELNLDQSKKLVYAQISGLNVSPQVTTTPANEFRSQPPPVPASPPAFSQSAGPQPPSSPPPSGSGKSSGGSGGEGSASSGASSGGGGGPSSGEGGGTGTSSGAGAGSGGSTAASSGTSSSVAIQGSSGSSSAQGNSSLSVTAPSAPAPTSTSPQTGGFCIY